MIFELKTILKESYRRRKNWGSFDDDGRSLDHLVFSKRNGIIFQVIFLL